jgi:hypothetical protein
MPRRSPPARAPIFQLKVTLEGVKPPVWRRLLVPADIPLHTLHAVLQEAMGWTDSHMHQFSLRDRRFGAPLQLREHGARRHALSAP